MSLNKGRIASLDGLRSVSILFVLLGHLYGTAHYPKNTFTLFLFRYSRFGVEVFFVISGFLITTLLLKESGQNGHIDLLAFYRRRAFRIFPACFAYIGIMWLTHRHLSKLGYALTYMMCYAARSAPWVLAHLWSLSVEEQFYLLWPLALVLGFSVRKQIGWAVMIAVPIARLWFWKHGMMDIDQYFPAVADALAAGCLLAIYYPRLRESVLWVKRPAVLAALAVFALSTPFAFDRHPHLYSAFGGLEPIAIALCIFALVERRDWLLNNWTTMQLGALSYSLYLWQQPFLNRGETHWWAAFPVNLVLAFACAYASYRLVELPMMRFKTSSRRTAPSAVPERSKAVGAAPL